MKKIVFFLIAFISVFTLNISINAWSKYEVGKKVEYNNISFYVIEDSDENNEIVKLLKEEPLKYDEIVNLGLSDINIRKDYSYGVVQYGSESANYSTSMVKKIVDEWSNSILKSGDSATARLISLDDLVDNLGYEIVEEGTTRRYVKTDKTPSPIYTYNGSLYYWTMTPNEDSSSLLVVRGDGGIDESNFSDTELVRPVIEIKKSALGDTNEQEETDKNIVPNNNSSSESKTTVNVGNTMQKVSIVLILIGVLLLSISIFLVIKNKHIIKNK